MSRSITIGGVERADLTRLESFSFQESAYRGEAGQGGFDVDSEGGAVTVAAWKAVVAADSDGGTFFVGQTVDRGVGRGPYTSDADAQWDVQVIDINTIMDDVLLRGSEWNRPEETDVERMQALVAFLNDEGYNIDDTYLLTASPEDMDAQDYRKQGVLPRAVADECAENSGKNWYLFWDRDIDQLGIWYGRETASNRTSDYGISSVLDDVDDDVTWAAEWPEESGLQLDPSRVYSAVQVVYGQTPSAVYVDRPATETAFKRREAVLFDASVKTETKATKLANHYLDYAETEDATITVAVTVPTTHVNAFQAGERIAIRAPHLGYDSPTFMRCRQRTVEPAGEESKAPDKYRVTLVLKPSTKVTRFGGRPSNDVPGQGDGTAGGGSTGDAAEVDAGACATPVSHSVSRQNNGNGTYSEGLGGPGSGDEIGSWVYNNAPYTDGTFPCPIGGGSWKGYYDVEYWAEFTAPADDPDEYLGMQVEIDATAAGTSGYFGGYSVRLAQGAAAAGRFGEGTTIARGPSPTTTVTIYIPRHLVDWGATNCIVLHPDWLCERLVQFCNQAVYFGNPHDDGRGQSGSIEDVTVGDICVLTFATGTAGIAQWVAGVGDVDGVNDTFELLKWTGDGSVGVTMNGLVSGAADYTTDTTAKTVTFLAPPPAGTVVLFQYEVQA